LTDWIQAGPVSCGSKFHGAFGKALNQLAPRLAEICVNMWTIGEGWEPHTTVGNSGLPPNSLPAKDFNMLRYASQVQASVVWVGGAAMLN
jgi:hypothetical protein